MARRGTIPEDPSQRMDTRGYTRMLQAVAVQSVVTNYPKGNGWKGGGGVTGERGESRVGANGSLRRTGELPHKAIPIPAAKPFSPPPPPPHQAGRRFSRLGNNGSYYFQPALLKHLFSGAGGRDYNEPLPSNTIPHQTQR